MAAASRSVRRVVRWVICGVRVEMRVRMDAMLVSSEVIGVGVGELGELNFRVEVSGE